MGYYEEDFSPACKPKKSKKIKVNTVCFEQTFQSVNDLIISAPVGIDIDDLTGKLNSKTHINILSKPILTADFNNDVLIIEGLLHVKIVFENPKPCPCTDELKSVCEEAFIPIQAVLSIKDCQKTCSFCCNDTLCIQTNAKVLSTSIFGYPNKNTMAAGKQVSLILKAVLEISVYILKDEFINLSYCNSRFDKY